MESSNKPRVVISSCLVGSNVRYDGGNKLDTYLRDTLGPLVEWVPLCPEAEAGFLVPREPMQLVTDGVRTRLITRETKQDMTDVLARWIDEKLKGLSRDRISGYVLKARSPSCGILDAELFSTTGKSVGFRAGLFAKAVMTFFPLLPVEDEERLRDPDVRANFLKRAFALKP